MTISNHGSIDFGVEELNYWKEVFNKETSKKKQAGSLFKILKLYIRNSVTYQLK
jgi:hypothetical protein